MHGTVKCDSVGILVQQKTLRQVLCEITQMSESDSKNCYLLYTAGKTLPEFENKKSVYAIMGHDGV